MKNVMFCLLAVFAAESARAATNDHSQNVYACSIWEPHQRGVEARVSPADQLHVHPLRDGIHELEIKWWSWTLNVSVRRIGEIPELLGAASHTNLKLRSHAPDVSVWCDKI